MMHNTLFHKYTTHKHKLIIRKVAVWQHATHEPMLKRAFWGRLETSYAYLSV